MAEEDENVRMAIVLTGDRALPSTESLGSHIRLPEARSQTNAASGEDDSFMLFGQGAICAILRFPAPCVFFHGQRSLLADDHWPEAWQPYRDHKAHMVVCVSSGPDLGTRDVLFSQLVSGSMAATSASLGVHCANSGILCKADQWSGVSGDRAPINSYYQGVGNAIERMRAYIQSYSWREDAILQVTKACSALEREMRDAINSNKLIPMLDPRIVGTEFRKLP